MRNLNTKLHQLIKSMSRNEKIYFKKTTLKQYLDLFDAINKQEEYDEEALIIII